MPITKFDAVAAAIVAKLKEAPALAGGVVTDETNFDELPENVNEGIRVTLLDSLPIAQYGTTTWRSTIRVACMARDDRAGIQGRATSRLGADVYLRLMADTKLGGLADSIEQPRIAPDANYYGTRLGVLNLDFPVRHLTANRSIT